jgi:hypothetical protein
MRGVSMSNVPMEDYDQDSLPVHTETYYSWCEYRLPYFPPRACRWHNGLIDSYDLTNPPPPVVTNQTSAICLGRTYVDG